MDQLKVVLEHRFWILSVLAVLIPPIGWYVSTGDMAAQTDIRTAKIKQKVKSIQDLTKDVAKVPNNDWIAGVTQVNTHLATRVDEMQKQLFDHQRPVMVWWPIVDKPLKEAQVKYRDDKPANPQAFANARRLFISRYGDMWRDDVYNIVDPFDMVTGLSPRGGPGKVLCTDQNGAVQITRAPVDSWVQRQMITAQEFWDAQEDLWMLHALMQAVARVNEGSINIDDARIKRLISAQLRGGSAGDLLDRQKKKQPNAAAGTAGAPGGPGMGSMGGFLGRRAGGDMGPKPLPMIDPDDIFGSDSEGTAVSGAGPTGIGAKKGGSVADAPPANSYVEQDTKWRARGFVLRLVMDHQEIPKLLTVLTDSPFPVQIWHVEHQPYDFQKNRQQSTIASDNEADQKQLKANEERLNLAMNQVNLAEVLVAGTFIFYNEPKTPTEQAAGAAPAAAKAPQPGKPASGSPSSTGAKPATSGPGVGPATKSPSSTKAGSPGTPSAPQSPKSTPPTAPATGSSSPKAVQPGKSKS
ncbi:MAG TPA: hypothetical protein VGP76_11715 [Planctomycetaceae bacterium]|nr:hypothetical protein [Planctomycetaceae bacterium]